MKIPLPKEVEMERGEIETLRHLFRHGPIWDGNLVSKQGRDAAVKRGLVDRAEGFNFLTREGVITMALAIGDTKR